MDEARRRSLLELAQAVWRRRKWLALLAAAVPFAAAASLILFLPNIYQSTATVLIERQQVPEVLVRSSVTGEVEMRLHAISQDVLSRARLEALIDRFELYPEARRTVPMRELVDRMRRDVRVELKGVERKGRGDVITSAFTVSYREPDPRRAAAVTNTLASFFVNENWKIRERQATGTSAFLRVQLEETKKRLDALERRVGEFKKRHIGELPEQMAANLATLEQLHAQLRLNSVNQSRAAERRDLRAELMDDTGPLAAGGPESTAARLARLRGELAKLRTQYSDRYPDVRSLRAEIGVLEERLASEPVPAAAAIDPARQRRRAHGELDAEITALKGEERRLRDAIATYQRRVENTPHREQAYRELARDYDATREHYASLMKRYEEASLGESLEQVRKGEHFRVVEPAWPADEPVAPNRLRLLLVGLALSLGLGAVATVAREHVDRSFHSLDEVRAFTTVPVAASIPLIATERDRDRRARRLRLAALGAVVLLAVVVAVAYLIADGNVQLVSLLAGGRS